MKKTFFSLFLASFFVVLSACNTGNVQVGNGSPQSAGTLSDTSPPQTAQELRTATRPLVAFERCLRIFPLNFRALRGNDMKGTNPEPDALRQSAQ